MISLILNILPESNQLSKKSFFQPIGCMAILMVNSDLDETLIQALLSPACYPHSVESVQLKETHISWLLLAGEYVYKIKKPVNFGFLDFTDLSRRRFFCEEELRLNRRLAAWLYLDVVEIGGSAEKPVWGLEPAIEYAVKMQRFAEDNLLDHLLAQDRLSVQHLNRLAMTLTKFHANLPIAAIDSSLGNAEAIALPARQNFQQLSLLLNENYSDRLANLNTASEKEYRHCLPLFKKRLESGWIRECHGDLHLGNIVLIDDQPTPFDCIEFNPALRWIDVMNDIAFLIMDLQQRQRPDLAYAFLNAYLQLSGDYIGLSVLRFYLGYRAMVMAKVNAIRAAQQGRYCEVDNCLRYLTLAEQFYTPSKPALIITYGLPGCGKTTVSQIVLEKFQAIRIRSDVERKRLFGLQAHESSESISGVNLYSQEATQRTYLRLLELTQTILQAGFSVIVDAAFLKQQEREQFKQLAEKLALPFAILNIHMDEELQKQRVRQRQNDASEADVSVLEQLKMIKQPLLASERKYTVELVNNGAISGLVDQHSAWNRFDQLLMRITAD